MRQARPKLPSSEEHGAVSRDVLSAALREVKRTYLDLNASLFSGRLLPPQLEWSDSGTEWGAWVKAHRTLRLSVRLLKGGWGELTEVLKHEMAHQYVDEVEGLPLGEGPHGRTFSEVCRARGIDPSATGDPAQGEATSEPESERRRALLSRIQSLLSLAQSDNHNEAQSAMAKAQKMMLKYNLEAAREDARYTFRHLGKPTGRRMAWQRLLSSVIGEHFFVEIIIVPYYRAEDKMRGSILEACGTPENLDIACYAHDFLEQAALSSWKKHKRERKLTRDSEKQSFLYGLISGFNEKLSAEKKKTEKEGLVWLGDPELSRYLRARHPYIRHVSGRSHIKKDAFSAGHEVGGRIVLYRGVQAGVNDRPPRLLVPGGRS